MCEKKIKVRNGKSMHDEEAHALEHKAGTVAISYKVPACLLRAWQQLWAEYQCMQWAVHLRWHPGCIGNGSGLVLIQMRVATMVSIWSSIDLIQSITISGLRWNYRGQSMGFGCKNGMSNQMIDLQPMWNEGKMKVIHNVGYPDPNYSHFRSSDIWASASDTDEYVGTGWIGRYIQQDMPALF